MTIQGRPYAAVLEERGVNPNLAKQNVNLARVLSDDIYKSAMYSAFSHEMTKVAVEAANTEEPGLKDYGASGLGSLLAGAGVGGTVGAVAGTAVSLKGRPLRGALTGAAAGGLIGAGLGYKSLREQRPVPGMERSMMNSAARESNYEMP